MYELCVCVFALKSVRDSQRGRRLKETSFAIVTINKMDQNHDSELFELASNYHHDDDVCSFGQNRRRQLVCSNGSSSGRALLATQAMTSPQRPMKNTEAERRKSWQIQALLHLFFACLTTLIVINCIPVLANEPQFSASQLEQQQQHFKSIIPQHNKRPVQVENNHIDHHNHHHHHHSHQESQAKREHIQQVPIVVSSSDNSYVSASPIEEFKPQQHRHHHHHFKLKRNRHSSNAQYHTNHKQQQQQKHSHHNRLLKHLDRTLISKNSQHGSTVNDGQLSSSDIYYSTPTTATTTQRNNRRNLVHSQQQYYNFPFDEQTTRSIFKDEINTHYLIRTAAIIKTRESIDRGATFLNYTIVTNLNACLVECWITDSCDTAIYQESPVDFNTNNLPDLLFKSPEQSSSSSIKFKSTISTNNRAYGNDDNESDNDIENDISIDDKDKKRSNDKVSNNRILEPEAGFFICYLFECAKAEGFKCQFSAHNYYVSAIKSHIGLTSPKLHSKVFLNELYPANGDTVNLNNMSTLVSDRKVLDKNVVVGEEEDGDDDDGDDDYEEEDVGEEATSENVCGVDSFKCLVGEDECISSSERCDGIAQCSDQSDELDCNLSTRNGYNNNIVMSDRKEAKHLAGPPNKRHSAKSLVENQDLSRETEFSLIEEATSKEPLNVEPPKYSKIIVSPKNHHSFNGRAQWHDSRVASIRIGQEYEEYGRGGFKSAFIAVMFGIGVTGMLVVIVGHKMKSIRRRLAYRARRRSLVPDADFLINSFNQQPAI